MRGAKNGSIVYTYVPQTIQWEITPHMSLFRSLLPRDQMNVFRAGARMGLPIGLGYFAVSFSLGIAARNAGLTAFQGFLASLLENASAGEYAAFALMAEGGTYLEMALVTLVANARYLLMSCALSQRFDPKTPYIHRLLMGFWITDEFFGITIARDGYVRPLYTYGAIAVAAPMWSVGTALGIIMGNILPLRVVSALSVALYGMFLAIVIPPCRENKVLYAVIGVCFLSSWGCSVLPGVMNLSGGTRTILLTVIISALAAWLFPIREEKKGGAMHEV